MRLRWRLGAQPSVSPLWWRDGTSPPRVGCNRGSLKQTTGSQIQGSATCTARLVDRLRIVDFGDPGSVDFFLTHLPPIGVRYLDNCQCRYFLRPDLLQPWEP